jgi:hypothetical protein
MLSGKKAPDQILIPPFHFPVYIKYQVLTDVFDSYVYENLKINP